MPEVMPNNRVPTKYRRRMVRTPKVAAGSLVVRTFMPPMNWKGRIAYAYMAVRKSPCARI